MNGTPVLCHTISKGILYVLCPLTYEIYSQSLPPACSTYGPGFLSQIVIRETRRRVKTYKGYCTWIHCELSWYSCFLYRCSTFSLLARNRYSWYNPPLQYRPQLTPPNTAPHFKSQTWFDSLYHRFSNTTTCFDFWPIAAVSGVRLHSSLAVLGELATVTNNPYLGHRFQDGPSITLLQLSVQRKLKEQHIPPIIHSLGFYY